MKPQRHGSGWAAHFILSLTVVAGFSLVAGCASQNPLTAPGGPFSRPVGAPEAPATPYAFPAVHDMPPDRAAPVLTEEQQKKLEADLVAARSRQGGSPAAGAKSTRKKPAKGATGTAGGNANP